MTTEEKFKPDLPRQYDPQKWGAFLMTNEEKLDSCPFCKKMPFTEEFHGYIGAICGTENCALKGTIIKIEKWNARASDEKLAKCINFIKYAATQYDTHFEANNLLEMFGLDKEELNETND